MTQRSTKAALAHVDEAAAVDEHRAMGFFKSVGASLLQGFGDLVHATTGERKMRDLVPHPKGATTLDIAAFSQIDYHSCGAVAGWCVVRSFDRRRTNFDRFYEACTTSEKHGTRTTPLIRALKAHGVGVSHIRREPSFEQLCGWIDEGFPVICVTDPDRRDRTEHWMVVYGYQRRPAQVLTAGNGWMHIFGVTLRGEHKVARRRLERQLEGEALVC
jgi:hypothetical protein